jgi:hypothetical protein
MNRSTFLDSACRICRNRRHLTWQGPNAGIIEPRVARIDVAGDPTRQNSSKRLSIQVFLTWLDVTRLLNRIGTCRDAARPAGDWSVDRH